jgi:hypothetical protein
MSVRLYHFVNDEDGIELKVFRAKRLGESTQESRQYWEVTWATINSSSFTSESVQ